MIAIPTPYSAQRTEWHEQDDGSMMQEWLPCTVVGYANDEDGTPGYLVEYVASGCQFLAVETMLRRFR